MAAAFTCTSLPPLSLRSETKAASSSLSSRRLFAVSPESGGLRIRLSQSPSSLTSIQPRVSRSRRGVVVCEAQETTTDSMLTSLSLFDLVSALLLVVYVEEMCDEHVSLERERETLPVGVIGLDTTEPLDHLHTTANSAKYRVLS